MRELKGFIEVTCLADGLRVAMRVDCVVSVYEVGEENDDGAIRPPHTAIQLSDGRIIRVTNKYQDVLRMIWESEL